MDTLINILGLFGTAVMAASLAMLLLKWEITANWWWRPAALVVGVGCCSTIVAMVWGRFKFVPYGYIVLLVVLIAWHVIEGTVTLARIDWKERREQKEKQMHPLIRRARALERSLGFPEAAKCYEEYLEEMPDDATVRGRLAETLIKAGRSKRAIAVLTVAFAQAQEDRERIAFGIRLAELLLVVKRDPLAARAQLEQLKNLYAETEHADYVESLSSEMTKRVSEGRYLKSGPGR